MTFDDEKDLTTRYRILLAPISEANPAGDDLSNNSATEWLNLREMRKGDYNGRLSIEAPPMEGPDWRGLCRLAVKSLERRSKNLQIAIWLLQGLGSTEGFSGLSHGLFLIRELLVRYWDCGLYPEGDEAEPSDYALRWRLLEWLERELPVWISTTPVTPSVNGVEYSLAECRSLASYLSVSDATCYDRWSCFSEKVELALEVQRTLRSTDVNFFSELLGQSARVQKQLERLSSYLSDLGRHFQFRASFESLELCEATVDKWRTEAPTHLIGQEAKDNLVDPLGNLVDPLVIEDPWERGLAWIRLQRLEDAARLLETCFMSMSAERDRFIHKLETAQVLFEVKRYDLAINILQPLSEQIEQFQLERWESLTVTGRVWKLLYDCYNCKEGRHSDKARDVEAKLCRSAPWKVLS